MVEVVATPDVRVRPEAAECLSDDGPFADRLFRECRPSPKAADKLYRNA